MSQTVTTSTMAGFVIPDTIANDETYSIHGIRKRVPELFENDECLKSAADEYDPCERPDLYEDEFINELYSDYGVPWRVAFAAEIASITSDHIIGIHATCDSDDKCAIGLFHHNVNPTDKEGIQLLLERAVEKDTLEAALREALSKTYPKQLVDDLVFDEDIWLSYWG